MYDGSKIIPGLIIFLCLITFPIWYTVAGGRSSYSPDPKTPADKKQCVEPAEYMTSSHMDLLNDWRDEVVRGENRIYEASDGKTYEMSLSNTCMNCHSNKADFCDECHNYVGVNPYCWDCHIEPAENR